MNTKKLRLGLIGKDVSKSPSGQIHTFILNELGVECEYEKMSVKADGFDNAMRRLLGDFDAFSVTIPYKRDVFEYLDGIEGEALACGAVNTVINATRQGYNTDGAGFIGVFFVVAVLPALLEELIFRGAILDGLKTAFGTLGSVLICGALFALYHQNPAQTAYQFCCGAAFALVAVKAGTILPTVLSHFINNAAIVIMFRAGLVEFSRGFKIPFMICSALALVGTIAYLVFFDKREKGTQTPRKSDFFKYAAAGIFIFALSWITTLISGL